mgnify:CR=1 FL=1
MGEKRAYKPRKPGGGRKKLKPDYDAGKNLKEQMESAVALYDSEMSLQAIGDALNLNPIKVRKLLITAGVYESDVAEKVKNTFEEYRETQDYKNLHHLKPQRRLTFPKPPSLRTCLIKKACTSQVQRKKRSVSEQNGREDTEQ